MTAPFVIYALPRSRTAWLSKFLSYGDWQCGHDELRHVRSLDDVTAWFSQPKTGSTETAAAPWWRLVQKLVPNIKTVVIRRPVNDVVHSLYKAGSTVDPVVMLKAMTRLDNKLDQIEARVPGCLSINFSALARQDVCAELFAFCTGEALNSNYWRDMDRTNVQVDFEKLERFCIAFRDRFAAIAAVAKQISLQDLRRIPAADIDGVTIGTEDFDTFLRDGTHLFRQHCVEVGEQPDAWMNKNIPLMRRLHSAGALFMTTARCNGRMFGYLMSIVSPSLEKTTGMQGIQTLFYTEPSIPGLGLQLQRAAIKTFREKGISEIFFREGIRGSGPRMRPLYKRLGAEPYGELYRMEA